MPTHALPLSPQDLMAEMAWASVHPLRQEVCQVGVTGQGLWGVAGGEEGSGHSFNLRTAMSILLYLSLAQEGA